MAWKKGQSGNPAGRPIGSGDKQFVEQLRIVLAEVVPDDPAGERKLRRIAEKLVDAALDGHSWAIQQVADRIDGKPAQESTVNFKEKREASDSTREELMAILAKQVKKDDAFVARHEFTRGRDVR